MSLASLTKHDGADSFVTSELLRDLAHRNGFTIPPSEEDAYLLALRSNRAIAVQVNNLTDYIDPRLSVVPTIWGTREYTRPTDMQNGLNAWCHVFDLKAESPSSTLLLGRSMALKDTIAVGGVAQTLGTFPQLLSATGNYPISQIDATVTRRVIQAGALVKGTSTCENYSLSPMSYSSASGPVHNPWLKGYNSGGSSSGSATLVALPIAREAGVCGLDDGGPGVDIAIGGDQAGSIRIPAAYCGIYGLKPTHGLVPYTGVAGLHPMVDHIGPLARNLNDIALCLTAIAGYDGLDGRMGPESPLRENVPSYHHQLNQYAAEIQADSSTEPESVPLRIGLITESFQIMGMSKEVAQSVEQAAVRHFTAMGGTGLICLRPITRARGYYLDGCDP